MIVPQDRGKPLDSSKAPLRRVAEEGQDVLVVPGGGAFADVVRDIDGKCDLSDDAAHWMALLAMDQYRLPPVGRNRRFPVRQNRRERHWIALAYEILRQDDASPHSWDVTSDTIAAWMAWKSGAKLIKATDVDGVLRDGTAIDIGQCQCAPVHGRDMRR